MTTAEKTYPALEELTETVSYYDHRPIENISINGIHMVVSYCSGMHVTHYVLHGHVNSTNLRIGQFSFHVSPIVGSKGESWHIDGTTLYLTNMCPY